MPFASILFADDSPSTAPAPIPRSIPQEPAFFVDLNLDQVVADLTTGRAQYHLEEFYRTPLRSVAAIGYRQQVFQDLERGDLRDRMAVFADGMTRMRQCLQQASALRHPLSAGTLDPGRRRRLLHHRDSRWSRTWAVQTSEPPDG